MAFAPIHCVCGRVHLEPHRRTFTSARCVVSAGAKARYARGVFSSRIVTAQSFALLALLPLLGCARSKERAKDVITSDASAPHHTPEQARALEDDTKAKPDASSHEPAAHDECARKGPLHCNVPAVADDAGVCETLAACLKQRRAHSSGVVEEVGDELHKLVGCSEVARAAVANDGGIDTVAVVTLRAETTTASCRPWAPPTRRQRTARIS